MPLERRGHTQGFEDATRIMKAGRANTSPDRSAGAASWTNPVIMRGDLSEEIKRMKGQPGKDILAHGGAGFARELVKTGLIDEFQLLVHPVALGSGLPLFSTLKKPLDLKLVDAKIFDSGAVAHVYRPE